MTISESLVKMRSGFVDNDLAGFSCTMAKQQRSALGDVYSEKAFVLSYELFPPKNEAGAVELRKNLGNLLEHDPSYVTCTYGAGGSTRESTLETLGQVQEISDVPVASHLTCVGASVEELRAYLDEAAARGVSYIVAIRGDAPQGESKFEAVQGGLSYASQLVSLIHDEYPHFGVVVGGYPETHPEAESADSDMQFLKQKVDCGADVVTTQLFYTNDDFYRFRDRCASAGIDVPIVPGLLPITSYQQIKRITLLCGAVLPVGLSDKLESCAEDVEEQLKVGIEHATAQSEDLVRQGVAGIHFYVLNRCRATCAILDALHIPEH